MRGGQVDKAAVVPVFAPGSAASVDEGADLLLWWSSHLLVLEANFLEEGEGASADERVPQVSGVGHVEARLGTVLKEVDHQKLARWKPLDLSIGRKARSSSFLG